MRRCGRVLIFFRVNIERESEGERYIFIERERDIILQVCLLFYDYCVVGNCYEVSGVGTRKKRL